MIGESNSGLVALASILSGGGGTAAQTSYDNTDSGLVATNVQGAIDEVHEEAHDATSAIGDLADLDTTDKSNLVNAINEVAGGGGGETWELINEINITEEVRTTSITKDLDGNTFRLKKARLIVYHPKYEGETEVPSYGLASINRSTADVLLYSSFPIASKDNPRSAMWTVEAKSYGGVYNEEYIATTSPTVTQQTAKVLFDGNFNNARFKRGCIYSGTTPADNYIEEIGVSYGFSVTGSKFILYGVRA